MVSEFTEGPNISCVVSYIHIGVNRFRISLKIRSLIIRGSGQVINPPVGVIIYTANIFSVRMTERWLPRSLTYDVIPKYTRVWMVGTRDTTASQVEERPPREGSCSFEVSAKYKQRRLKMGEREGGRDLWV